MKCLNKTDFSAKVIYGWSLSKKSADISTTGDENGHFVLLGAPGNVTDMRRHSHTVRSPRSVHKSAPVTPLNRSTTNVNTMEQTQ